MSLRLVITIFGIRDPWRMGKTCPHKNLCFLRHPTEQLVVYTEVKVYTVQVYTGQYKCTLDVQMYTVEKNSEKIKKIEMLQICNTFKGVKRSIFILLLH